MSALPNHCFAFHLIKKLDKSAFFGGQIGDKDEKYKKHDSLGTTLFNLKEARPFS